MTGLQVVASSGAPVLPVIEGELSSNEWSDAEFINATCAAIPREQRAQAVAALLSIVGRRN